jgi:hypothetical protein
MLDLLMGYAVPTVIHIIGVKADRIEENSEISVGLPEYRPITSPRHILAQTL